MNTTKKSKSASRTGRHWLSRINSIDSENSGSQDSTSAQRSESVVPIPYFDTNLGPTIEDSDVRARLRELYEKSTQKVASRKTSRSKKAPVEAADPTVGHARVPRPKSDLSEEPTRWIKIIDEPELPRQQQPASTEIPIERELRAEESMADESVDARYSDSIDRLTAAISQRFTRPAVLVFVGSEDNPHTDETCAQVAYWLAQKNSSRVLLVDSNPAGNLTQISQSEGKAGVSSIVNRDINWQSTILQPSSKLDFLPCGNEPFHRWGGTQRLSNAAGQMKLRYRYICVSAGDARSESAKIWSSFSDGSYLMVSLKNSNEAIAESAVKEMQRDGARLLGCVVTDSP